ncbi:AraC family transcriptional regulator [Motiliproteus coralliicola]|uniref:AraC family transcriptional regulator n=2 Tax=Motiliproteus coralliicola TaxID=2283196 RepID=A0A369WH20_9GAMM|nr:AraC family transcriptional regulator [Motiliproteus coralliicola]
MTKRSVTYFETELDRIYSELSLRPEHYARVRQSKAFMEKFYSDKVELDDLAEAACISRFHYVRIFQRVYGLTPRAYLRDLRISKAKELIKQGTPITQTCFDVGYESVPTFSSVFKKCTGHTPTAYQRLQHSNLE